jgi:hypothetical protein
MHGMLAELGRQMREKSSVIQSGIKALDWYLTGKGTGPGRDSRETMLPAQIEI